MNIWKHFPTKNLGKKHIKLVEKGLKEQYTPKNEEIDIFTGKTVDKVNKPRMQPIFLPVVKAFMGPFKAGFTKHLQLYLELA